MLSKLLKYDLKYMLKSIGIFYILTIFFSLTTRIFFSLEQTFIINILGQISAGCMYAMIANTIINTIMRSWVRFKESVYGDESYLTHTLPVSKTSIYESKFLLTLIYQLVGFVVIVLGLLIAYYTNERWDMLVTFIENISGMLNVSIVPLLIALIVILYLEIFNIIQCGFLGTILGNRQNDYRFGFSLMFGFISYMVSQGFVILVVFVTGLFNKDIMNIFTSNATPSMDVIKNILVLAIVSYTAVNVIANLVCSKMLNKGVNVE